MIIIIDKHHSSSKKRRGPKAYQIKPPTQEKFLAECLFCYGVFDRNAVSLQQRLIRNNNNNNNKEEENKEKFLICDKCFTDEVMNKQYVDQNDIIQEFYRTFGMRRK